MNRQFSRKAQRKQDRLEKKKNKDLYFHRRKELTENSKNGVSYDNYKSVSTDETEQPKRKRKRSKINSNGQPKKTRFEIEREKKFIREEERDIKKYEKLLKLRSYTKRKRLPKSFYLDGLGELMEICDRKLYDNRIAGDDDDDLDYLRQKRESANKSVHEKTKKTSKKGNTCQQKESEQESNEEQSDDSEDAEEDSFQEINDNEDDVDGEDDEADDEGQFDNSDDEAMDDTNEEELDNSFEGEEEDDGSEEEDEEDEENDNRDDEEDPMIKRKTTKTLKSKNEDHQYHEDIYGITRDREGNVVRPEKIDIAAKLDALNSNVVVDDTIQRKVRGLLNRLTADNIKGISGEITKLYKANSRAVINRAILNVVEKVVFGVDYQVPAKLVTELAMLVAILYNEMGDEAGGFFMHSAVRQFDSLYQSEKGHAWTTESKRLDNVVILLMNLYATGLVDCALMYDVVDKFVDRFSEEKSIELIDLMLKTVGFFLRKDDAGRMRSLILTVQHKCTELNMGGLSGSRIKFILESLTAIKNNNVAKLRITEPVVLAELIESTLKGVIKRPRVACIHGQYAQVIQSAHWFSFTATIVPLEAINAKEFHHNEQSESVLADGDDTQMDYDLRDRLCRTLGINTPLRKQLFTALLQCNDYVDAACKLISVGKKQFSEVIHVVLHVAIKERTFNHFYVHLLNHLSTCDRKYKVALDFAVRDKIKQLNDPRVHLSPANRDNLATLIFHLLKVNALFISCLKVVEFSEINAENLDFILKIMRPLFSECDESTIESILSRMPKKDCKAFYLFLQVFMDDNAKNRLSSLNQLQHMWKV